MKLELGLLCE